MFFTFTKNHILSEMGAIPSKYTSLLVANIVEGRKLNAQVLFFLKIYITNNANQ